MKKLAIYILMLAAALTVASQSFAQTSTSPADSDKKPEKLGEVVVKEQKIKPSLIAPNAEAAKTEIEKTPGGVQVIDAEQYKKGRATTLDDLLKMSPGVMSGARGGDGEEVKLSIRGSAIDRGYHLRGVLILQDGIPLGFADGQGNFQSMEPLATRYMEVWRGGNGLRYGATALGGAINFVSQTGLDASPFQARLEAGSFGYWRGQISTGGARGALDYYASGSAFFRDGFQDHSQTESGRFFGNLGYRANENVETRFYVTFVHADQELAGNLTQAQYRNTPRMANPSSVAFDEQHNVESFRLANRTTVKLSDAQRLEFSAYWGYETLHHPLFWNGFFLNGLGIIDNSAHTFGGDARFVSERELFGRRNEFIIGFAPAFTMLNEQRHANLGGGAQGPLTADQEVRAANLNLYAENVHHLNDKWSLVLGGQFVYAPRDFRDKFTTDPNGDQSQDKDYFAFNPKAGVIFEPRKDWQFFANVSQSFEPPTGIELAQLGGPAGDILAANLKAQRATTVEVGTRGAANRFSWELVFFNSWVRNELLTVNDALGNPLGTVNEPKTIHRGVEMGLDVSLLEGMLCKADDKNKTPDRLVLRQVANWNDFRFDGSSVYGDKRLAGAPEFWYRGELMYELPCGFYAGPNIECATKTPADYQNTLFADPYTIFGFKVGYRSQKGWSVFIEGRNLGDKHYASAVEPIPDATTAFGPPEIFRSGEGRAVYGGIEFRW